MVDLVFDEPDDRPGKLFLNGEEIGGVVLAEMRSRPGRYELRGAPVPPRYDPWSFARFNITAGPEAAVAFGEWLAGWLVIPIPWDSPARPEPPEPPPTRWRTLRRAWSPRS